MVVIFPALAIFTYCADSLAAVYHTYFFALKDTVGVVSFSCGCFFDILRDDRDPIIEVPEELWPFLNRLPDFIVDVSVA